MSYNRINLLNRIIEIREIVLREKKHDTPQIKIYEKFIKDRFHISYSCFNIYMGINAKAELKKLQEKEALDKQQLTLF